MASFLEYSPEKVMSIRNTSVQPQIALKEMVTHSKNEQRKKVKRNSNEYNIFFGNSPKHIAK